MRYTGIRDHATRPPPSFAMHCKRCPITGSPNTLYRGSPMPPRTRTSLYSPHPGIAMTQKWIAELPAKTGRSLDNWLRLIAREGPPTEPERRAWLKEHYGLGTNSAWWLAERSVGKGREDGDPELYLEAAERHVEEM